MSTGFIPANQLIIISGLVFIPATTISLIFYSTFGYFLTEGLNLNLKKNNINKAPQSERDTEALVASRVAYTVVYACDNVGLSNTTLY